MSKRGSGILPFLILAVLAAGSVRPALAQGVTVAILPASNQVDPGDVFDLEITITQAGSAFNGFDAVVTYDDSLLSFIALSPKSLQEGPLMKSACSNRFHVFNPSPGSLQITDVLLCAGVQVTGPGVIYKLRFQADSALVGVAHVDFESIRFAADGNPVEPVNSSNAVVTVGNSTGFSPEDPSAGSRSVLRPAYPNPIRNGARIAFEPAATGSARLEIFSVSGRSVRVLFEGPVTANVPEEVPFDGRDADGSRLPAGIYFSRLTVPDGVLLSRMTLLP